MSDREGNAVNLYRMNVGQDESSARRLTDFGELDVLWFDVSADTDPADFELAIDPFMFNLGLSYRFDLP